MQSKLPIEHPVLEKTQLRQHFRQVRHGLDRILLSEQICAHLAHNPRLLAAKTILAYVAFGSEVNLGSLFEALPEKHWGIPRCLPQRQMQWHRYRPEALVRNHFGLPEPAPSSEVLDPDAADLILVPALACDLLGGRLGYGGGYYDRFLQNRLTPKWGIVPQACLLGDPLPQDDWDQRLDGIQTENGFYWTGIP
ncbi:5-formyltetrahydrofolate cyclo-ligase [Synechococcus sp. Nb3U1]|uniref:5-formyltetrahydrofolate cyclo-ligase n=1 Tax=Synechococcus sp. Nb3U1 TaxID=1914529 RepID=UPI001F378B65|nr:5-formyltetrahydrofolate cyclo-ligase [Synechococcus sp. Nb3U1]MCF2970454.1 5-formyltetrahydrofolate cyclo-ligase [Synechococcus sp. Nb3U1]